MRVDKFTRTTFTSADKAQDAVNDPFFAGLELVGDETYMVSKHKRVIKHRLPYAVGFFVYQAAKKVLLEFCLDFIDHYIPREKYQALFTDTDCISLALAEETLDDCVKPELKNDFLQHGKPKFLVCNESQSRDCGKFKEEFGTTTGGYVGLCSKMYYCSDVENSKYSCKGLSKKTNDLTYQLYKDVLFGAERQSGVNYGIRRKGNEMFSYEQQRACLSAFYIKRYVNDDHITTKPLNL